MAFQLAYESNAFEDTMMERQTVFEQLKIQIDLILSEFLEAITRQRITLEMPEFVPSFSHKFIVRTTGSFSRLMQTDVSFIILMDHLLILIYNELKLKDCISKCVEMNDANGIKYCI